MVTIISTLPARRMVGRLVPQVRCAAEREPALTAGWRVAAVHRSVVMAMICYLLSMGTVYSQTITPMDKSSQSDSEPAVAPDAAEQTQDVPGASWRAASTAAGSRAPADTSLQAHRIRSGRSAVPVQSGGKDMLPNDQGQVWRQYDISKYTSRIRDVEDPEQAIIDWILRETGTEVWFTRPLGLLNADRSTLSVYHTPEMQKIVAAVVGHFVNGSLDRQLLSLRLVAVNSPNWRTSVTRILQPVDVQTVGVEAWLLSKENAATLLADLRRRSDFREYNAAQLPFFNGQPASVAQLRPRTFVRSYRARENAWYGHEPEMAQLQEGFTLQISPLISQDETTIDAVIKCNIDQVERLVSVPVDLPGLNGQVQRAEIHVPQLVSWRLHDRFRWPADQVLLLSCGVVASPGPSQATTFGIPNPFISRAARSDALLFIAGEGKSSQGDVPGSAATLGNAATGSNGRY